MIGEYSAASLLEQTNNPISFKSLILQIDMTWICKKKERTKENEGGRKKVCVAKSSYHCASHRQARPHGCSIIC